MLVFTLLIAVLAFRDKCGSEHSTYFMENKEVPFIADTFHTKSVCRKISNAEFRTLVNAPVGYDVDHIIETENDDPELAKCDKNILGNLILAPSSWNRGVGNLCYQYGRAEKLAVYGNIREMASQNVARCCAEEGMATIMIVAFLCIVAIIPITITAFLIKKYFA